jgi:hypothetical protein
VAQATPRSSNWLEPLRTSPSGVKETRGDAAAPTSPAAAPANLSSPAGADRPAAKADAAKDRGGSGGEGSRQPQTAKPPSVATPPKEPTPQRPPARPFDPKDAGSRRYDVASAQKSSPPPPPPAPVQASPPKAQPTQLAMDNRTPPPTMVDAAPRGSGAAPRKPSPHSPTIDQPSNKSKRVTIDLSGPAIGRAPHWIGYRVADLPPSIVAKDADFLWMDNGVWLGDEPKGTGILNTPGRHEITVLVVAKNNEEYRGKAVVEVLEPLAPPASARRGS